MEYYGHISGCISQMWGAQATNTHHVLPLQAVIQVYNKNITYEYVSLELILSLIPISQAHIGFITEEAEYVLQVL